ncbi:MAG: ABC transporter ATP-binding protein [Bacteroidota bacterium]
MAPRITIDKLSYRYFADGNPVFSDFSLDIPGGTCCALLGPTGAGKTTLLEILSGVAGSQCKTSLAAGSLQIGDERYESIPQAALFPKVGLVLQDPEVQISGIRDTVATEVEFTLEQLSIPVAERERRVRNTLNELALAPLAQRHPQEVSGGERQRVALASILVAAPPFLLLDEPANALDSRSQQLLREILRARKGSTTMIVSDYSIDLSLGLADLFVVLAEGNIVFQGTSADLFRNLDPLRDFLPLDYWTLLRGRKPQSRVRVPL